MVKQLLVSSEKTHILVSEGGIILIISSEQQLRTSCQQLFQQVENIIRKEII